LRRRKEGVQTTISNPLTIIQGRPQVKCRKPQVVTGKECGDLVLKRKTSCLVKRRKEEGTVALPKRNGTKTEIQGRE